MNHLVGVLSLFYKLSLSEDDFFGNRDLDAQHVN